MSIEIDDIRFCNWCYIDPSAPEGVLFIYTSETPISTEAFCALLKGVVREPNLDLCKPFTHLFTRHDKVPNLNSDEAN